jgi:hypothetical protein
MKQEKYKQIHDILLARMRRNVRLKKTDEIKKTGQKLHRLRLRYRKRFAARIPGALLLVFWAAALFRFFQLRHQRIDASQESHFIAA